MVRAINYCGLRIEYKLVKKPIKNINIRIKPDGSIFVSAPENISSKIVDGFVEGKAEWIFRRIADVERARESMPDDDFYNGKILYYLGSSYELQIIDANGFDVKFMDGKIIIYAKDGTDIKTKYIKWLSEQARPIFEDSLGRMLELAAEFDLKKPEIYIRNMRSRWGSCNKAKCRIGLNVQLMKADPECIDQVVLHEVIHFISYDHSDRFYGILDRLMPDWRVRKKRLETEYVDGIR